jgi:hypothetical protein
MAPRYGRFANRPYGVGACTKHFFRGTLKEWCELTVYHFAGRGKTIVRGFECQ